MVQQRVQTGGPLRSAVPFPSPAAYPYYFVGDGGPATTTTGTDTTPVAGTNFWGALNVAGPALLTGVSYLIGSVGGTDSVIVYLFDDAGLVVANSAPAGVVVGTTATFQRVPFVTPYNAVRTGIYYAGLVFNGTTARFRTHAFGEFPANSATGVFGTAPTITLSTAFSASKAPYATTY